MLARLGEFSRLFDQPCCRATAARRNHQTFASEPLFGQVETAADFGEETAHTRRNIPIAVIVATLFAIVLYLWTTYSFYHARHSGLLNCEPEPPPPTAPVIATPRLNPALSVPSSAA